MKIFNFMQKSNVKKRQKKKAYIYLFVHISNSKLLFVLFLNDFLFALFYFISSIKIQN